MPMARSAYRHNHRSKWKHRTPSREPDVRWCTDDHEWPDLALIQGRLGEHAPRCELEAVVISVDVVQTDRSHVQPNAYELLRHRPDHLLARAANECLDSGELRSPANELERMLLHEKA